MAATLLSSSCGSSSSTTTVAPTPVRCQVQVTGTSSSFPAGGGAGHLNVAAARECQWAAAAQADWIALVQPASGQGEGAVQFAVQPNAIPSARRGSIVVEGQTVEVSQAAAQCTYDLDRRTAEHAATGAPGTINIRTHAVCPWTATSDAAWLTLTDRQGTGPAGVRYTVASNDGPARRARLTIGGHTVEVLQAAAGGSAPPPPAPDPAPSPGPGPGPAPDPPPNPPPPPPGQPDPQCEYSISPEGRSAPADGGTNSVQVRTDAGCAWTASSGVPWVTVTGGASGTGRGDVQYSVARNTSTATRTGTLTIAGRTFTVEQRGAPPSQASLSGEARNVRGSCPSLTFSIGTTGVSTNGDTTFNRGNCRHVTNGTGVNVTGWRQPDNSVLATRVELQRGQNSEEGEEGEGEEGGP